eukprot:g6032.t1
MPGSSRKQDSLSTGSGAFKLPRTRPISFSMASLKKKEIRIHARGEITGHAEICIREQGKKICWPMDIFVDNALGHKQTPLGKEIRLHFCPDRIRDIGSYAVNTDYEWQQCLRKWHREYPSRIVAQCSTLCKTSLEKLEVNWGTKNDPKMALVSIPSGADGPDARNRKMHSVYQYHEIGEMAYHLPGISFPDKAIHALLAGLRCPDRPFSSACAAALWAIINSSVSARLQCIAYCEYAAERIVTETFQWSKAVVTNSLGDKSFSTEAFNRAGLLCSCIMHPTTTKVFLRQKHLVQTICNLMQTTHKAVLQMTLEMACRIFHGYTSDVEEELRDEFMDQEGIKILLQSTIEKILPTDAPTTTILNALTICCCFAPTVESRKHLYKARGQLFGILEDFLAKDEHNLNYPMIKPFIERLCYIAWSVGTAINENCHGNYHSSDIEFGVTMSKVVLSSSVFHVHKIPGAHMYLLLCMMDLIKVPAFAKAICSNGDFIEEMKTGGFEKPLNVEHPTITPSQLAEAHMIILASIAQHDRKLGLREVLLKHGARRTLIDLCTIQIVDTIEKPMDSFTLHLMSFSVSLLCDCSFKIMRREQDFVDITDVIEIFLFKTTDPMIQMNALLSMYNMGRAPASPMLGTITNNDTIEKLVDIIELVELYEGHVVVSEKAKRLMKEYCIGEEAIQSFVWHSFCLLILIAGSSNLAKDVMFSINVLPRVLQSCVGRSGQVHTDYVEADHHEMEKIDGQLRKLCFMLCWKMCLDDRVLSVLYEHEICSMIIACVRHEKASPSLKMLGIDFLQALVVDITHTLHDPNSLQALSLKQHIDIPTICELATEMIQSTSAVIVAHGALTIARIALWPKGATILKPSVDFLVSALYTTKDHEDVNEAILHAILNLSINSTNQARICKLLLKDLMWIALEGKPRQTQVRSQIEHADDHEAHQDISFLDNILSRRYSSLVHSNNKRGSKIKNFASRCLSNLCRNKQNRTEFYKLELEMYTPTKKKDAPSPPHKAKKNSVDHTEDESLLSDSRVLRKRDAKTDKIRGNFSKWLDDVRGADNKAEKVKRLSKGPKDIHNLSQVLHNTELSKLPMTQNLRQPMSKLWKNGVATRFVGFGSPLQWQGADGSIVWRDMPTWKSPTLGSTGSLPGSFRSSTDRMSLPLRTAGLSPTRPVEMSPRTHMPLSTASRQSPRKRRWMPKVHSVQSIVDETAEVDVVTEVKNGEPGTNQIQITATEEKTEDTYDRHGVPMEIELQPNSPRHKFRFIPPNYYDHHVVAWRLSIIGFVEADRPHLEQALSEHFQVAENDIMTRVDPRQGRSDFQDVHMTGGKGKEASVKLAKDVDYFVKTPQDQLELLENFVQVLEAEERSIPSNLRIYKPELPRIFMRPDEDDMPENYVPPEARTRRLLKFNHVEGAKCYTGLFRKYHGPDGKSFFLYAVNTLLEAPVKEVQIPNIPTDDQNIDVFADAVARHHEEPLAGITVVSTLPAASPRIFFPEITHSGTPRRVHTKVDDKRGHLFIQSTSMAESLMPCFRLDLVDAKGARRDEVVTAAPTESEESAKGKRKSKGHKKSKSGRKKH